MSSKKANEISRKISSHRQKNNFHAQSLCCTVASSLAWLVVEQFCFFVLLHLFHSQALACCEINPAPLSSSPSKMRGIAPGPPTPTGRARANTWSFSKVWKLTFPSDCCSMCFSGRTQQATAQGQCPVSGLSPEMPVFAFWLRLLMRGAVSYWSGAVLISLMTPDPPGGEHDRTRRDCPDTDKLSCSAGSVRTLSLNHRGSFAGEEASWPTLPTSGAPKSAEG